MSAYKVALWDGAYLDVHVFSVTLAVYSYRTIIYISSIWKRCVGWLVGWKHCDYYDQTTCTCVCVRMSVCFRVMQFPQSPDVSSSELRMCTCARVHVCVCETNLRFVRTNYTFAQTAKPGCARNCNSTVDPVDCTTQQRNNNSNATATAPITAT